MPPDRPIPATSSFGNLPDLRQRLIALPKAEVHVHLEGCFDVDDMLELAARSHVPLPRPPERLFEFSGLSDFLEFLDWLCALVRSQDQLATIAYRFSERMARSGVGYADAIINPSHWSHWRTRLGELIDGLDAGFRDAERDALPPVRLCISLSRDQSAAAATELVDALIALDHPRVVALSVDGNESSAGRTGLRFAEAFREAGAHGLRRTVHAGESSGPEGVRDALELLGADRIDHGVRAIEDPALVRQLADQGVPLGVCPTSNLMHLYPSIAAHPIEPLRRAGVRVSVNTDDPALLRTTLPDEYARCATAYSWDTETVRAVARTSIEASFAPPEIKARLFAALAAWS
jgi:adenosine deaminase